MVYIEQVVLDNLIVNGVLLYLTTAVLRRKLVWWRFAVSAALGTLFAVFLPFIDKALIVFKLAALIATTAFATRHGGVKGYLLFILSFALISFAVGGAVYGLFNLSIGKNGTLVYPHGKGLKYLVFSALAFVCVVIRQIRRFALRRQISALKGEFATISICGNSFSVKCLDDSGNRLMDNLTLKPVMVLSGDIGKKYLKGTERTIEVSTVNDSSFLPIITVDKITFSGAHNARAYERIPAAVSDNVFDDYKLIVNCGALDAVIHN